ncbi:hypothetical protein HNQ50_001972 [Silvimonas terrae]|uniref:Uncharacterized protein n=1 Tax=Silvimonas terrae TaxID=300266 RepID=A0A840RCP5_9NEIS|nr:hypothetical protein [Silvimonas terrae]MBB5191249.1 hypothetical protein [Silvimonas terrae]
MNAFATPEQKAVPSQPDAGQIKLRPSFAQRNPAGFAWLLGTGKPDQKTSPERK